VNNTVLSTSHIASAPSVVTLLSTSVSVDSNMAMARTKNTEQKSRSSSGNSSSTNVHTCFVCGFQCALAYNFRHHLAQKHWKKEDGTAADTTYREWYANTRSDKSAGTVGTTLSCEGAVCDVEPVTAPHSKYVRRIKRAGNSKVVGPQRSRKEALTEKIIISDKDLICTHHRCVETVENHGKKSKKHGTLSKKLQKSRQNHGSLYSC